VYFYTEIIHYFYLFFFPSGFEPYWVTFFKLFSKAQMIREKKKSKKEKPHTNTKDPEKLLI